MSQSPPADWYIDPENSSLLRYWDGLEWTESRVPRDVHTGVAPSTPSAEAPETQPDAEPEPTVSTPLAGAVATPAAASPKLVSTPARYWLGGSRGWPSVDVVGEAYREGEVLAALGRRPKLDEEIELREVASLVPEPDNPHDRNAVSVRISGHLVGYLSKDDAKRYKPYIDRVVASGHIATTNASIWGVLRKTYDGATRFNSNVRLALSEPHLLLPVNDPPPAAYSVLPWGGGLQVTGEDQHFDVLKQFVGRHDRELLIVTLHRGVEAKPRGDREFVEVRVGGQRIGEMSTATSKHFFPILDHLDSKGLTAAAWAHLKGSSLTAEVVLQAVKASEVEDVWLAGEAETVPALVPEASSYYVPPAYLTPKRTTPARAKATTEEKGKRPDPMASALRASTAPAKSGCGVIVLVAAAAAVTVPVFTHFV